MDRGGGVTWFRIKVNGTPVYEEAWLNMTRTEFSLWDALPAEYREKGVKVTDVRYMAGDGMTVEMEDDIPSPEFRVIVDGREVYVAPWDGRFDVTAVWEMIPQRFKDADMYVTYVSMQGDSLTVELWRGQRTEGDERCSTPSRSSSRRAGLTNGSTGCSTTWAITTRT